MTAGGMLPEADVFPQTRAADPDGAVPGSGKTFDWDLLQKLPSTEKQVLLAGGLNPDNVGEALTACAGKIDGVDTSSGVERTDGNGKSKERIEAFVRAVRGNK